VDQRCPDCVWRDSVLPPYPVVAMTCRHTFNDSADWLLIAAHLTSPNLSSRDTPNRTTLGLAEILNYGCSRTWHLRAAIELLRLKRQSSSCCWLQQQWRILVARPTDEWLFLFFLMSLSHTDFASLYYALVLDDRLLAPSVGRYLPLSTYYGEEKKSEETL
jgi:hypothetical protein